MFQYHYEISNKGVKVNYIHLLLVSAIANVKGAYERGFFSKAADEFCFGHAAVKPSRGKHAAFYPELFPQLYQSQVCSPQRYVLQIPGDPLNWLGPPI